MTSSIALHRQIERKRSSDQPSQNKTRGETIPHALLPTKNTKREAPRGTQSGTETKFRERSSSPITKNQFAVYLETGGVQLSLADGGGFAAGPVGGPGDRET